MITHFSSIYAPKVVAVPPTFAVRDLCRTADGELRHYGWRTDGEGRRRVFISSRDARNWTTHDAAENDAGTMVKSPYGGGWVSLADRDGELCAIRSKTGPGDTEAEVTPLGWRNLGVRQLLAMKSRRRWIACLSDVSCPGNECYHSVVALSDDDGQSWLRVNIAPIPDIPRLFPGDKRPRWFNNGCEPTVAELADGSLLLAVRASGNHHFLYRSADGGETWGEPEEAPAFHATNTMPYLFRLSDGRLLFFWNNTSILPTRDISEYSEAHAGERSGKWELAFTNRDALHAAISEDDGRTWIGFREIILNPARNDADFREHVNDPAEEHDMSVHQTQALELDGGKVLLALGQHAASRRLVVFDPQWLYETDRAEDFRTGLGNVSNHLYVRSLSGGWRGWAGHCAWNRLPGALLVRDPDTGPDTVRDVLQLCRIRDPRLVSDRQGVVWNFPAGLSGRLEVECRIDGDGFQLALCDHWINPCDETVAEKAALAIPVTAENLGGSGKWTSLTRVWDWNDGKALLDCSSHTRTLELRTCGLSPFGPSYLHLQTLATETDSKGAYFRSFRKTALH